MSGGGADNRPEDLAEAKKVLIEGLEMQKNLKNHEKTYINAYQLLMDLFITTGDMEGFKHWLEVDAGESTELQQLSLVYEAYYELYFGDERRAKALLEEEIHPAYHQREQQTLLGEIALRQGDLESAETHMSRTNNRNSGEIKEYHRSVFGTAALAHQDFWLDIYKKDLAGYFTLSGRVTFEGEPMPFVEVYAKGAQDRGWSSSGERFVAITDEDGYFESIGLRRGSYDIGLGIDNSRIYDKYYVQRQGDLADGQFILESDHYLELEFRKPIEFQEKEIQYSITEEEEFTLSWELVEDASYYEVQFLSFTHPKEMAGGHSPRPLTNIQGAQRFEENQGTFTIENINRTQPVGLVSFGGEEMLISPSGVLRPILPGITYPLIIKALDEDGKEINSSLALMGDYTKVPNFTLEGELTTGEELILDQNYPEAITYYKAHINDEEIREEALRTLSLLYHHGWKRGEEDQELALTYAEEYYRESGNSKYLEMIIGNMSLEEVAKNRSMIENLLDTIEVPKTSYYMQQVRANLYLIDQNWEQALGVYEENEDTLSWEVLYLDLLLGDYPSAAKRLRDGRFHVYRMDPLRTEEALQTLADEGLSKADEIRLKTLMEALLTESRDSAEEVYREILPDVGSKALWDLLYEIHLSNNWDRVW